MRRLSLLGRRTGSTLLLLGVALGPALAALPPGLLGEPEVCRMACSLKGRPCCCQSSLWKSWSHRHEEPAFEAAARMASARGCPDASSAGAGAPQLSPSLAPSVFERAPRLATRAIARAATYRSGSLRRSLATLPRPPPDLPAVS